MDGWSNRNNNAHLKRVDKSHITKHEEKKKKRNNKGNTIIGTFAYLQTTLPVCEA